MPLDAEGADIDVPPQPLPEYPPTDSFAQPE
jgi:hypothetical protein